MNNTGIIILAAGGSTRFGRLKQLARFNGKSLIANAVETALAANCPEICVVLGNDFEAVRNEIGNFPVRIARNRDWQSGMGTSIRTGLYELIRVFSEMDSVIIMLADQPLIESRHLVALSDKFRSTGKPIVVSQFQETRGVPALFAREFFPDLFLIEGDRGAREIIRKNPDMTAGVMMPEAGIDIDTESDLESLKKIR